MAETKIATVDELLALPNADAVTEIVEVEPGVRVVCSALEMAKYTRMRSDCNQGDKFDQERWETWLVKNGIAQPELTFEQAEQFKKKRVKTVDKVYDTILRLSGITPAGELAEKAVQEAEAAFRQG